MSHSSIFSDRPAPNTRRKILTLLLVLGVITSGLGIFAFTDTASAIGEDWIEGYDYRKSHVIQANAAVTGSYEIPFVVHYGAGIDGNTTIGTTDYGVVYLNSHCNANFSDVMFTASDGSTALDYWMESKTDSSVAYFWVEITGGLASAYTMFIYYGNATRTVSTSNAANTFPLFDGFSSYDTGKWLQKTSAGTATYTYTDGVLNVTTTSDSNNKYAGVISANADAGTNNIAFITKFHTNFPGASSIPLMFMYDMQTQNTLGSTNTGYQARLGNSASIYPSHNEWTGSAWNQFATGTFTTVSGTEYILTTKNTGNTKVLDLAYADHTAAVTVTGTDDSKTTGWYYVCLYSPTSTTASLYLDYFIIRHCVASEPVHGIWSGEENTLFGFSSSPVLLAMVGNVYTYQCTINTTVTAWSLYEAPEFLTISSTGYISGVPEYADLGNHTVTINATTTEGPIQQSYTLLVDQIVPSQILYAVTNRTYSYYITAASGNNYDYEMVDGPGFLTLTDDLLYGIPTLPGTYNVSIRMTAYTHYWQNYTIVTYDNSTIYSITNGDNCVLYPVGGSEGTAVYADNKLFITYFGYSPSLSAWVGCYDYELGVWLDAAMVDTIPSGDSHGDPRMVIDDNGIIHLWCGAHNTNTERYYRSNYSYNISAWTLVSSSFMGTACTYPIPFKDPTNGDLYLLMRTDDGTANAKWSYKMSTNNGTTWTTYANIINTGTDDNTCIYMADIYIDVRNGHVEVYLCCNLNSGTYGYDNIRDDFCIVKWNLTDKHIYTLDDGDLGTILELGEYNTYKIAQTDTDQFACYGSLMVKNNTVYFCYQKSGIGDMWNGSNPSDGKYYIMRYVDGSWTTKLEIPFAHRQNEAGYGTLVDHDTNLKIFCTEYIPVNSTTWATSVVEYTIDWDLTNISRTGVILSPTESYSGVVEYGWQYCSRIANDPYHGMVYSTHGATDGSQYGDQTIIIYNDFGLQNNDQVGWLTAPIYEITSTPESTGYYGVAYSYQAVCNGTVNRWRIDGTSGLFISAAGLVYGTISINGVYYVNITAETNFNIATQNYVLTIADAPTYTITSSPVTDGTEGVAYSYQAVCNGSVSSWSLSGAAFLNISSSGLVSGTPGAGTAGAYSVVIQAITGANTCWQNYTLTIVEGEFNFFTSSPITTVYEGFGYIYQVTTSEEVISWSLSGGGAGIHITEDGLVYSTGTGAVGTTFALSINATTVEGTYWQNYTLTVISMFTSSPSLIGMDNEAYSYQVVARDAVLEYNLTGASWLTISSTGLITGTPPLGAAGEYEIAIAVWTMYGEEPARSNQIFTLTVLPNAAYAVTSDPVTNATANETYEYQVTSRYTVTSWNITGPDWLAINATGMITGTAPNGTQGSFNVSVRLTLTDGSLAYQNYTLEVAGPPTSWSDGLAIAFGILAFLIVISAILSIVGSARRRY